MPSVPYDPFLPRRTGGVGGIVQPPPAPAIAPPVDNRTAYTGSINATPDAPATVPGSALPPNTGGSQLASHTGSSGYSGYTPKPVYYTPEQLGVSSGNRTWGIDPMQSARLGGSPYLGYNAESNAANQQLQMQAYGAAQRTAPQIDMGATNMFAQGTGNALTNANQTNLLGISTLAGADRSNLHAMQQANSLSDLANGRGAMGQFGAADALMGMSQMPAGPSVAEQQLRMGGDAAMRQQMAMAAGARGGNASLALQNAAQNQGDVMGQMNAQLGVQRAQEDMANRQFAANAAQGAGNMYGNAAGTQAGAYGSAANIFGNVAGNQVAQAGQLGNIANNQLGQAGVNKDLTSIYAQNAGEQARLQGAQNQLNDQTMLGSQAMGYGLLSDQAKRETDQYNAANNYNLSKDLGYKGIQLQRDLQNDAQSNEWMKSLAKGLGAAAGATAGFFAGGPAGAVAGGTGGYKLADAATSSDVRAKKDISPADEQISDAFRSAHASANQLMGMKVAYPQLNAPGYSYEYKDPNSVGAEPGQKFGPMAQDLEKTPAGASVVHEVNGRKAIDPGRLSLLNASETSKQRQELDAIKAKLFGEASGQQFAPTSGITGQRVMYHNGKPVMTGTDANGNQVVLDDRPIGASFAGYGAPGEMSGYQPKHGPVMQDGPMRVMGMGQDGRPIMAPQQTPSAGPSIGFGQGDMGYDIGPAPMATRKRDPRFGLGYIGM